MRLDYIIFLGIRNLLNHRMRSLLTVGGVAIGIAAIVFLIALGYGLQKMMTSEIATSEALQTFELNTGQSEILKLDEAGIVKIKSLENVGEIIPVTEVASTIKTKETKVDGITYSAEPRYIELSQIVFYKGNIYKGDGGKEVVISRNALELLGYKDQTQAMGQTIDIDLMLTKILAPSISEDTMKSITDFKIVGIIDDKTSPYLYTPSKALITDAGVLNYTQAKVKVKDKSKIAKTRTDVENLGYTTVYIGDTLEQINSVFKIFQIVLLSFGIVALFVAALGMFNTLTVSLLERTREIGIMKAMGMTRWDVWRMFLIESVIISTCGGAGGIILGYGAGKVMDLALNILAKRSGSEPVSIFWIPALFIVGLIGFIVFVGFITGFYPAKRAARINPLDALRYE